MSPILNMCLLAANSDRIVEGLFSFGCSVDKAIQQDEISRMKILPESQIQNR